jgi:hypothetical protein
MGDRRRFEVVADFVARNFPPCRMLDVAGGTEQLSQKLSQRGFDCTVIDPRRIKRLQGRRIERVRACFTPQMAVGYDLVVGLHPDGATQNIARCAVDGWPVVIVPCCNLWPTSSPFWCSDVSEAIRRYWSSQKVRWWETRLPISGKNLVLVAK